MEPFLPLLHCHYFEMKIVQRSCNWRNLLDLFASLIGQPPGGMKVGAPLLGILRLNMIMNF